jgi:hypothetical protein
MSPVAVFEVGGGHPVEMWPGRALVRFLVVPGQGLRKRRLRVKASQRIRS